LDLKSKNIGFKINPFKWIKTNMDLDHYGLDFVIWIFYPPLVATMQGEFEMSMMGELSFFLGL